LGREHRTKADDRVVIVSLGLLALLFADVRKGNVDACRQAQAPA